MKLIKVVHLKKNPFNIKSIEDKQKEASSLSEKVRLDTANSLSISLAGLGIQNGFFQCLERYGPVSVKEFAKKVVYKRDTRVTGL